MSVCCHLVTMDVTSSSGLLQVAVGGDKMKYEVYCCGVMLAVAVCYCLSSFAGVSHIVLLMYSDAV